MRLVRLKRFLILDMLDLINALVNGFGFVFMLRLLLVLRLIL